MRKIKRYSTFIANVNGWKDQGINTKGSMLRLLQFCVENGISSFCSFPTPDVPAQDENFGVAFAESGLDRSEVQFISKFDATTDFSEQKINGFIDDTLFSSHTDYLDLLLVKNITEECERVLEGLKQQGKLLQYGWIVEQPLEVSKTENLPEAIEMDFSISDFLKFKNALPQLNGEKINVFMNTFSADFFKTENLQVQRLENLAWSIAPKYKLEKNALLLMWLRSFFPDIHIFVNTPSENAIKSIRNATEIGLDQRDLKLLEEAFNSN